MTSENKETKNKSFDFKLEVKDKLSGFCAITTAILILFIIIALWAAVLGFGTAVAYKIFMLFV